jgi:predicted dehydrogenase
MSGVRIEGVCSRSRESARAFAQKTSSLRDFDQQEELLEAVDAVYIAPPHLTHVPFATKAPIAGKHVLCEKPLCFTKHEAERLHRLASEQSLVLLEAIKTAYLPGFQRMIAVAQNGMIGRICSVSATCTMLRPPTGRGHDVSQAGEASQSSPIIPCWPSLRPLVLIESILPIRGQSVTPKRALTLSPVSRFSSKTPLPPARPALE